MKQSWEWDPSGVDTQSHALVHHSVPTETLPALTFSDLHLLGSPAALLVTRQDSAPNSASPQLSWICFGEGLPQRLGG